MTSFQEKCSATAKSRYYILSGIFLPALGKIPIREAIGFASGRIAATALAVEQFRARDGSLPENLAVLAPRYMKSAPTDPFDGQPLRYRRVDKGYVIYSVGSDGQDNDGRKKPADQKSTNKTPYDITFTVER